MGARPVKTPVDPKPSPRKPWTLGVRVWSSLMCRLRAESPKLMRVCSLLLSKDKGLGFRVLFSRPQASPAHYPKFHLVNTHFKSSGLTDSSCGASHVSRVPRRMAPSPTSGIISWGSGRVTVRVLGTLPVPFCSCAKPQEGWCSVWGGRVLRLTIGHVRRNPVVGFKVITRLCSTHHTPLKLIYQLHRTF